MSESIEWVRETMHQFGEQLIEIRRDMADVRDRLIRMEASSVHKTVETLENAYQEVLRRIDSLESSRDHDKGVDKGVSKTADWIIKLAPWLFATGMVVISNWQHLFGH